MPCCWFVISPVISGIMRLSRCRILIDSLVLPLWSPFFYFYTVSFSSSPHASHPSCITGSSYLLKGQQIWTFQAVALGHSSSANVGLQKWLSVVLVYFYYDFVWGYYCSNIIICTQICKFVSFFCRFFYILPNILSNYLTTACRRLMRQC